MAEVETKGISHSKADLKSKVAHRHLGSREQTIQGDESLRMFQDKDRQSPTETH